MFARRLYTLLIRFCGMVGLAGLTALGAVALIAAYNAGARALAFFAGCFFFIAIVSLVSAWTAWRD